MEDLNIEKQYNSLKKKYSLPDFRALDREFEISTIESDIFLLREIRKKIQDKLDTFIKILESLLQPDSGSIASMYECAFFDESEKKKMYSLFKKLMDFDRQALILELKDEEKHESEFINNAFKEWTDIKSRLSSFLEKMKDSWSKELKEKEETFYMG